MNMKSNFEADKQTATHEYPPNGMIYKREKDIWLFWSERTLQRIKSQLSESQFQLLKPLVKGQ